MIAPSTGGDNPQLKEAIIAEILAAPQQRITFRRFMEMALYQPELGYYTQRGGLIGARGDFYTAPHLSPTFGELVGGQVAEFWRKLDCPARFEVLEVGAGQGLLASDILTRLRADEPALWRALHYTIAEISEPLRLAQRRRLEAVPGGDEFTGKVSWRSLSEFGPATLTGAVVSNELLDAFPVHLLTLQDRQWRELYVTWHPPSRTFREEAGPLSDPALAQYWERLDLDLSLYEDGYRTELNLAMLDWLDQIGGLLRRGFILTIDYGYPAPQRYHPLRREGTLQCYSSHLVHSNPYINIGRQDMTSHVDFTSLMERGRALGWQTAGLTRQSAFLASLGIGEKLAALGQPDYRRQAGLTTKQLLAEREALQRLINPNVMGNFGVLIQAKAVPPEQLNLSGLAFTL